MWVLAQKGGTDLNIWDSSWNFRKKAGDEPTLIGIEPAKMWCSPIKHVESKPLFDTYIICWWYLHVYVTEYRGILMKFALFGNWTNKKKRISPPQSVLGRFAASRVVNCVASLWCFRWLKLLWFVYSSTGLHQKKHTFCRKKQTLPCLLLCCEFSSAVAVPGPRSRLDQRERRVWSSHILTYGRVVETYWIG